MSEWMTLASCRPISLSAITAVSHPHHQLYDYCPNNCCHLFILPFLHWLRLPLIYNIFKVLLCVSVWRQTFPKQLPHFPLTLHLSPSFFKKSLVSWQDWFNYSIFVVGVDLSFCWLKKKQTDFVCKPYSPPSLIPSLRALRADLRDRSFWEGPHG